MRTSVASSRIVAGCGLNQVDFRTLVCLHFFVELIEVVLGGHPGGEVFAGHRNGGDQAIEPFAQSNVLFQQSTLSIFESPIAPRLVRQQSLIFLDCERISREPT